MINMASKNRSGRKSPDKVNHEGLSACSRNALLMDARKAAVNKLAARTAATVSSMSFSEIAHEEFYTVKPIMEIGDRYAS